MSSVDPEIVMNARNTNEALKMFQKAKMEYFEQR